MAAKRKKAIHPVFDPLKAKRYAERVKALMIERKALNEDISEVCAEAKDDGLEPTFIRFAAGEALKDEAERNARDEKRSLYLHALGLAVHAVESGEMSARQAAKIYKIGKSSVYKELSVREVSADTPPEAAALPAHDADGVVIESPAAKASDAESPQGPLTSTDLAGAAGGVDAPAPIPESCGGRGVQTTGDNPAPHASRSQQGQATSDNASPLPIEAGQECAAVGNVAKPETDPGRPPRPSPPQDPIEDISETHRGATPSKDGAKVVRTEPSMSGSVAASGDVVRDASAMPLDVVAAPHSEGREHAGSAATAPPACDQPVASAPATDFTDKIKALSLSISPREPLPAEAFKTAAQLWDEVGEQPLCLRRSA
jgi:uncharacterized protein (UPF0335 family)